MISPSNREVDIHLDNQDEYIGMCRREVLDSFLRNRAADFGAHLVNGLVTRMTPVLIARAPTPSPIPITAVVRPPVRPAASTWI